MSIVIPFQLKLPPKDLYKRQYVDIVTEAMSHNEEIVLIGFGTLIPRPQTERLARNPKTGTPVMIPARTTVKFKPGKYLLDAINKPEEKK